MDGLAQYEQIATYYRGEIVTGRFKIGDCLPTLKQIGTDWGVTKGTAGRAVEQLRLEGLVLTEGRLGTRVIGPVETTMAIALHYKDLVVADTTIITAVDSVALELGVAAGTTILLVRLSAQP